ncbi:uncharacterized protein LOC133818004 [Humulus lupulus]|uniref:uncharacterized protein LOC133818004 n=1 Tax=Humulus lupulus TaxID=3486 RepID=UPI002B402960|nr:uncharacterized protein LOC133818004 [Humulus lupulus]
MNEGRIFSRLDRVFKNEDWLDIFPHSEAVFNWELHSDHCYCIIKPDIAVNCGVKLFRFFNMWTKHDQFKSTVMQSWCRPMRGTGLVRLCNKLRRLQLVLRRFNRHIMGDVAQNFFEAKENYQAAQVSLQGDPHSLRLQKIEADAGESLACHAKIYESFLRQKSKLDWLRFGDDNTAYFHACLKQRRASNCITSVVNESGQSIENFDVVVDHFVNHFKKIMGSKSMASSTIQKSCFELGHQLTLDQQDIIKGYKRKNISPKCVLKIDLSKAYDMLDWNFLEDILNEFRFLAKFIKWVMACLKDPTYLLLMNGKVQGEFRGRKGLRQGDLISPLLFVLAMEYCTRLFQQASMNKGYRFHPKCKHLKIVNLCFADDLVIFCKGVHNSVQIIKESFSDFCCASGLIANKDKSQVYFGGVAEDEAQNLLEGLQFTEGHFPLKYLGVPLRTTRWKAGDCSLIIKKI